MNKSFDNLHESLSPTELTEIIAESATPAEITAINEHAKNVVWSMVQYKKLQMIYTCALKEIRTKLEILNTEFQSHYRRNPINSINTRLKSTDSIFHKLEKYKVPVTLESVEEHVLDLAGIRIVCSYTDDIYDIADALLKQDDITLIEKKDYIKNPKPNGYRSLHLIVKIPVFFVEQKKLVPVEVQIRTIAMDFWASLEHQIRYKHNISEQEKINAELKACADIITETDQRMLKLRMQVEVAEDAPTEEDALLEQLCHLDAPIT